MKLLTKYNRINILLVVAVCLLSSIALNYFVRNTLISELDEVLTEIKDKANQYTVDHQKIPINSSLDDYQITFEPLNKPTHNVQFSTISKIIPEKNKTQNYRELKYSIVIAGKLYLVKIEKPIEGMKHMAANIINLTIATILVVIFFLMLANRFVLARLWRPFYASLEVIKDFQINKENNLSFPVTTTDEFIYMNEILKKSIQKAEEDYFALKEFTENASHELQTPLAIIGSKLDLLIQDENLNEKQESKIMSAYAALKRMSQLNQTLLLSAKIGNQQFKNTNTISLKQKIEEKLTQFQELWEHRISIQATIDEAFIIMNKDLNETLMNNLLSNATKHNHKDGYIHIDLVPGKFVIKNSSASASLDSTKLFQRFYKNEQNSQGNGLGLSIVKQICDTSGISIHYLYSENSHTFMLTWEIKNMLDLQKKFQNNVAANYSFPKYSIAS